MPNQTEQELEGLLFEAHVREAQQAVREAVEDTVGDLNADPGGSEVSEDEIWHEMTKAISDSGEYPRDVADEVRRRAGLDPLDPPHIARMGLDEYLAWCAGTTWKDDL